MTTLDSSGVNVGLASLVVGGRRSCRGTAGWVVSRSVLAGWVGIRSPWALWGGSVREAPCHRFERLGILFGQWQTDLARYGPRSGASSHNFDSQR